VKTSLVVFGGDDSCARSILCQHPESQLAAHKTTLIMLH
jgi:hypothetical protein